ncbi:MAG: L-seryl-tRNA(Sec) selenium transferase [Candidatus Zixiibacteriota bacterium]|nr:MAG: L-seryl-tRNA(Sec) selenium transferase [candidate division Zixibacteria bacterium]
MDAVLQSRLKALPQVNALLETPPLRDLAAAWSHELIKRFARDAIEESRQDLLAGAEAVPDMEILIRRVQIRLEAFLEPRLQRVINATGILLHTGLGRAPLLDEAFRRAFERVRGACNLELDLATGQRGDRQDTLGDLLEFLTGAESSAVVNNNAAAVLLALNTLANRREAIVSRGQLIEIGGSFRLPEVMRKSGARLVEVGTTNRTYLQDYEAALSPKTGAVLLAHTSNYRVKGFVHEVEIGELAGLCRRYNVPLIHDLGGGVLLDLARWGLPPEPLASAGVVAGADVVTFSGDKILGGPQAGILVGRRETLAKVRKNPLMRALRPDKFTLALLEETLKLYLAPERLLEHHPVLARLAESPEAAQSRAQALRDRLDTLGLPEEVTVEIVPAKAQLGSGALPLEEFPSAALRVSVRGMPAAVLAQGLRRENPPVVGYLQREALLLDLKAVPDEEIALLAEILAGALKKKNFTTSVPSGKVK